MKLRVITTDADRAVALLHHLEDVATSRYTRSMVEGRTIIADVDERDIPAVQQVLALWHRWIVSIT